MNGAEAFAREYNVSRETMARLEVYHALLGKWTSKINLISKASYADAWTRHFADSAQLWALRSEAAASWMDLGSGGGFPGLVVAIIAAGEAPEMKVTLVESDQRKSAFLATVARECGLATAIISERIEAVTAKAEVISARALAPLPDLLAFSEKARLPGGICLFPKGETVHKEIADASRQWRFDYRVHPSRTDERAAIVEIGAFARV